MIRILLALALIDAGGRGNYCHISDDIFSFLVRKTHAFAYATKIPQVTSPQNTILNREFLAHMAKPD